MATSTRNLCRGFRQITRSIPPPAKRKPIRSQSQLRAFASTTYRQADDTASTGKAPAYWAKSAEQVSSQSTPKQRQPQPEGLHESEYLTPDQPYTVSDLDARERADYDVLSPPEQKEFLKLQNHFKALFESDEGKAELESMTDQIDRDIERTGGPDTVIEFPTTRVKGNEAGYWAEDEDDEIGQMEDADDEWSDEYITSVAETELGMHRDIREYTRIAAWDLPLLQQYVKPFQPPNHSTPLRFRYTTYMGEHHPAARKVVVEFSTKDLLSHPSSQYKLTQQQQQKLIKLAGVRYNLHTDTIKISSEKFDSPAQNKRYLGELVGKLIAEAKDKRDMFDDVPLDIRHVKNLKRNKTIQYPESWKLKKQELKPLIEKRKEQLLLEAGQKDEYGTDKEDVIDGRQMLEAYVRVGLSNAVNAAALAGGAAGKGKAGGGPARRKTNALPL